MKTLSKTSILLIVSVMALAAFAVPTLASAATWSAPGTIIGHSSALALTATTGLGQATVSCTAQFDGTVVNTRGVAAGSINSITFATPTTACTGGGIAGGCTLDVVATGLPWAITTSGTTLTISGSRQVGHSLGRARGRALRMSWREL
jgi:hypothetical protein